MEHGYVQITGSGGELTCLLGPEPPTITGGIGGWEVTGRPKQVGILTWAGVEPFQMTVSLMLDGFGRNRSIEPDLATLVGFARGEGGEPPSRIHENGIPTPPGVRDWVIEAMDFGEAIIRSDTRARIRQPLTLTLREYVAASFKRAEHGRKVRIVTSKKGDDVSKLAKRCMVKWTALRDANPKLVKKANQKLKTGTKLRCPPRPQAHLPMPVTKTKS